MQGQTLGYISSIEPGQTFDRSLYQPLDLNGNNMRLIRLRQDDRTGASSSIHIECDMKTVSLYPRWSPDANKPRYIALSYCWTEAKPTCRIRINGAILWVRPNLYAFLQQMYREHQEDWIFVDALCIHQEDIAERNHQVTLMGDIYQNAYKAIVWLGETNFLDIKAEHRVKFVCEQIQGDATAGRTSVNITVDCEQEVRMCSNAFFAREYWHRVWIVQEILLPPAVEFRAGTLSLDFSGFSELCGHYHTLRNRGEATDQWTEYDEAKHLLHWRSNVQPRVWNENPLLTIAETVALAFLKRCTEQRDRIYGLIGLTRSKYTKVDYEMPVDELLLRTFIAGMLEKRRESYDRARQPYGLEDNSFQRSFDSRVETMLGLPHALSLDSGDSQIYAAMQLAIELCASHQVWSWQGDVSIERALELVSFISTYDYKSAASSANSLAHRLPSLADLFSDMDVAPVEFNGESLVRACAPVTFYQMQKLAEAGSSGSPEIKEFMSLVRWVRSIFRDVARQM